MPDNFLLHCKSSYEHKSNIILSTSTRLEQPHHIKNMMIYNIMKGADYIVILYYINTFIMAAALLGFLSENVVLITIVGIFLLLLVVNFPIKKKKQKKHEVIRPVTDVIGSIPERVEELNQELKPFGFAYEPYQDIFYSIMYPWQREVGYCRLYDEACAPLSMIIDSEPIKFNYDGRKCIELEGPIWYE